jgi:hypothetical protein
VGLKQIKKHYSCTSTRLQSSAGLTRIPLNSNSKLKIAFSLPVEKKIKFKFEIAKVWNKVHGNFEKIIDQF